MATVFCDRKGLLMLEFMQQVTTITLEVYCETLKKKKLRRAIQSKRYGMLIYGIVLLHNSSLPHTAARIKALLWHVNWALSDQPPYSPDLAPGQYRPFTYLRNMAELTGSILL
jgi:hypothetical protein